MFCNFIIDESAEIYFIRFHNSPCRLCGLFSYTKSTRNKTQRKFIPITIIDYHYPDESLDTVEIDGKKIFQQSCASCHSIFKDLAGPALIGVSERWPDKKKLYEFIKIPYPFFKKDPYVKKLVTKYGLLTPGFNINDNEIEAILRYIEIESKRSYLPTS